MPYYETVVIARQDIAAPQIEGLADNLAKLVEDQGGRVAKREQWGLRTLTFRIRKNRKGHYVFFNIDAPAKAIHELERHMRLNEDILRYLTVRVEELEEGPSAMMQSRGRDDRGRRDGRPPRDGDHRGPRGGDRERSGNGGPRGGGERERGGEAGRGSREGERREGASS